MASISDSAGIKLLTIAQQIQACPVPTDDEKAFMARPLVLANLPHRDPGNVPVWRRENGRFKLTIYPVLDARDRPRHPYGSIPRLLLFWIVTEAARTRSRRLELGATLADFMRQVGLSPETGGGKRGDAHRLRDQMERLFRAQITFEEAGRQPQDRSLWANMPITDSGEIWWNDTTPSQRALFGSYIILGEAFFHAITVSPVPVDRRALKALRRSPLALDLYAWATHRVYGLGDEGSFIPWSGLRRQIGAAYSDPKNFQKAAKQALRKIALVYLGLRYCCEPGGIRILPGSSTAVPSNKSGKSSRIHGETVPQPKAALTKGLGSYPQIGTVKRYP